MGHETLVLLFCTLVGFVTAGVASSFYQLVTNQPAEFRLGHLSFVTAFAALLMFAFTGPAIIVRKLWERRGELRAALALGGATVALVWSACTGIVVVGFWVSLGSGLV